MSKILFVGHSHIVALRDAHGQARGGAEREFVWVNQAEFQPEMHGEVLNPAIAARIQAAPMPRCMCRCSAAMTIPSSAYSTTLGHSRSCCPSAGFICG